MVMKIYLKITIPLHKANEQRVKEALYTICKKSQLVICQDKKGRTLDVVRLEDIFNKEEK
jgi:hypothetical protein